MNKWKSQLSPEVKQILKDVNGIAKINKDGSFLSNQTNIPEVIEKAYYTALKTQLLMISSSIDHWILKGTPMRKEETISADTSDTRTMV